MKGIGGCVTVVLATMYALWRRAFKCPLCACSGEKLLSIHLSRVKTTTGKQLRELVWHPKSVKYGR